MWGNSYFRDFNCLYVLWQVIHAVADGYSQMFTLAGLLFGIPVVGSFHTDIIDLLSTHNAYEFQKFCITAKERIDSMVLDSCATTSLSFAVRICLTQLFCRNANGLMFCFAEKIGKTRSLLWARDCDSSGREDVLSCKKEWVSEEQWECVIVDN